MKNLILKFKEIILYFKELDHDEFEETECKTCFRCKRKFRKNVRHSMKHSFNIDYANDDEIIERIIVDTDCDDYEFDVCDSCLHEFILWMNMNETI